jgi:peptidoglycan/LPS O-acetylase OafA/YrhL
MMPKDSDSRRLHSIDALRGLAVVLMFLHHFPKWLMIDSDNSVTYALMFIASRFSAPLFLLIVGLCLVLSTERKQDKRAAIEHTIKKGIFIMLSGFLLNIIIYAPLPELNILHTIGLSMILIAPAAINPSAAKSIASIMIISAASILAPAIPQLNDILGSSQFPPLPWMMFTMLGVIVGQIILRLQKNGETKKIPLSLEVVSFILMLSALAFILLGDSFNYYPATWSFIALAASIILYATAIFYWIYEVLGKRPAILRPLETYGLFAYILYFSHHIFVATIPKQLNLLNKFSETEVLGYMLLFLLASWLLMEYALNALQKKRDKQCS